MLAIRYDSLGMRESVNECRLRLLFRKRVNAGIVFRLLRTRQRDEDRMKTRKIIAPRDCPFCGEKLLQGTTIDWDGFRSTGIEWIIHPTSTSKLKCDIIQFHLMAHPEGSRPHSKKERNGFAISPDEAYSFGRALLHAAVSNPQFESYWTKWKRRHAHARRRK